MAGQREEPWQQARKHRARQRPVEDKEELCQKIRKDCGSPILVPGIGTQARMQFRGNCAFARVPEQQGNKTPTDNDSNSKSQQRHYHIINLVPSRRTPSLDVIGKVEVLGVPTSVS